MVALKDMIGAIVKKLKISKHYSFEIILSKLKKKNQSETANRIRI